MVSYHACQECLNYCYIKGKGKYMLSMYVLLFQMLMLFTVCCMKQRKEEGSSTSHSQSKTASLALRVPKLLLGDVSDSPCRMVDLANPERTVDQT